jgi:hypothetical protein
VIPQEHDEAGDERSESDHDHHARNRADHFVPHGDRVTTEVARERDGDKFRKHHQDDPRDCQQPHPRLACEPTPHDREVNQSSVSSVGTDGSRKSRESRSVGDLTPAITPASVPSCGTCFVPH